MGIAATPQMDKACEETIQGSSGEVEQLDVWRAHPEWKEETPLVEVTNPKGTFCQLQCSALVALPPQQVFALLADTGNQRIFKNVKGVRDRRVVEEDEKRAVVELEMITGWRFLFFSGEFGVHMRLTHKRPELKIDFELFQQGMMRHFTGEWTVEPVVVDDSGNTESINSPMGVGKRVASRVTLVQSVQPAVSPPPILAHYLRHIAAKTIGETLRDLQHEAACIRYNVGEGENRHGELQRQISERRHATPVMSVS